MEEYKKEGEEISRKFKEKEMEAKRRYRKNSNENSTF